MAKYLQKIKDLISAFKYFEIRQIPKLKNFQVDMLSKVATSKPVDLPEQVFFEVVEAVAISEPIMLVQVEEKLCWINPLLNYLKDGTLPSDREEARRVRH